MIQTLFSTTAEFARQKSKTIKENKASREKIDKEINQEEIKTYDPLPVKDEKIKAKEEKVETKVKRKPLKTYDLDSLGDAKVNNYKSRQVEFADLNENFRREFVSHCRYLLVVVYHKSFCSCHFFGKDHREFQYRQSFPHP